MVGGVEFVQGAETEALEELENTLTATIKSYLPPNFNKLEQKEQELLTNASGLPSSRGCGLLQLYHQS